MSKNGARRQMSKMSPQTEKSDKKSVESSLTQNGPLGPFFDVWWVRKGEGLFWHFHDPGSLSPL